MKPLTLAQDKVMTMIKEHIEATGMPPTRAEICRYFGFKSPTAAEDHLRALARKGAIELTPGASRGIRVTAGIGLPLVGKVAAGKPVLAVENVERHIPLDKNLFRSRPDYLLRVEGDSMRDAGILDGDILVVRRTSSPADGQIVVARLDDEVTVKRYRRNRRSISLIPENPAYDIIRVGPGRRSLVIEGVVVGLLRNH